jgi:AcrR family transcriptional regulator
MAIDTRDRILDAARDLFLENGPEAVSMRRVAADAGLTAMAIYRHFKNRDALLKAVVLKGHFLFLQYLQRSLAAPTPWDRLAQSGSQYLAFALENPRDYAILFMQAVGPEDEGARGPEWWQDAATFRFLVDRIREAGDCGLLLISDPEQTALTVWAHVHGLVSLYLANKLNLDEATFRNVYAASVGRLISAFQAPVAIPKRLGKR